MIQDRPFIESLDGVRLANQMAAVVTLMSDGQWHTLRELSNASGGSEAGVSARLRDLRKPEFGSQLIERRRVAGGLFAYRWMNPVIEVQGQLFGAAK